MPPSHLSLIQLEVVFFHAVAFKLETTPPWSKDWALATIIITTVFPIECSHVTTP